MSNSDLEQTGYELHFEPLSDPRHDCAFPCDASGQVDMDRLGDSALHRYLYARAVIGKVFRYPSVRSRARR
ncbi:hypothetical protein [Azohydromonas caseinilytica]|uniref:Uncharacterized protein n=1 Tax=Azohydromonas caseinilytica TaxID=2728836 RepID=A0A848FEJ1_9BURK|nr:hypothetical protein [Azohydromonas caseinilytica]NML17828.1 hypothetical protein [Azohydromonas caseinilytica]